MGEGAGGGGVWHTIKAVGAHVLTPEELLNHSCFFREDIGQAEAEEMVTTALSLAMTRDGSSGGMIRLAICDKSGNTHRSIAGDKVKVSWDEALDAPIAVQ